MPPYPARRWRHLLAIAGHAERGQSRRQTRDGCRRVVVGRPRGIQADAHGPDRTVDGEWLEVEPRVVRDDRDAAAGRCDRLGDLG
jgi:hypothetical protein